MSKMFSESALELAKQIEIKQSNFKYREIVKGFTIDAEKSKDLDDGINCDFSNNQYKIEVSISDVAEFIHPYDELFAIALSRVETRYLSDSNIPMLPFVLSENKLSLLTGAPRPALTFYIHLDTSLEIVYFDIKETLFKNIMKVHHSQFDDIVYGRVESKYKDKFIFMYDLAQKLLDNRRMKGALAIYDIKKGIRTTEEGQIIPLDDENRHLSNIVVQEFMILCNKAIAYYFAGNDLPLIYRNHIPRMSTPERFKIIEQIDLAVNEPKFLPTLKEKSNLWFKKAKYDIVNEGHYGLNEAVYSHVTSPIRRITDLINHQLIKKSKFGKQFEFSNDELKEMIEHINHKKEKYSEEKSEYFKDIAKTAVKIKLNSSSSEELIEMSDKDFEAVLKLAVKNSMLFENLKDAINKKLNNNSINALMVYDVFFENENLDDNWEEIKKIFLRYCYANNGLSISIMNLALQKDKIENYVVKSITEANGFLSMASATLNNKTYVFEHKQTFSQKKESESKSTVRLMCDIFGIDIEFNDINRREIALDSLQDNDNIDYISKLNEFLQKNKLTNVPEFKFIINGPPDNPLIECQMTLEIQGNVISSFSKAGNKKLAKQICVKNAFEILKNIEIKVTDRIKKNPDQFENYVGMLQDYCTKYYKIMPEYKYFEQGLSHIKEFFCVAEIKINENIYQAKGEAKTKANSKQLAAKNLLIELKELLPISFV